MLVMMTTNFLTVAQVANLFQVHKMTILRLIKDEELSAIHLGRTYRIPVQSLFDYCSTHLIGKRADQQQFLQELLQPGR